MYKYMYMCTYVCVKAVSCQNYCHAHTRLHMYMYPKNLMLRQLLF